MTDYLTDSELAAAQQKPVNAGAVMFNGYAFTDYDAQAYNNFLYDLNKENHKPTREFLLDQRHKLFCSIIGLYTDNRYYITYQYRNFESDVWYDKGAVYKAQSPQQALDKLEALFDDKMHLVCRVLSCVKLED